MKVMSSSTWPPVNTQCTINMRFYLCVQLVLINHVSKQGRFSSQNWVYLRCGIKKRTQIATSECLEVIHLVRTAVQRWLMYVELLFRWLGINSGSAVKSTENNPIKQLWVRKYPSFGFLILQAAAWGLRSDLNTGGLNLSAQKHTGARACAESPFRDEGGRRRRGEERLEWGGDKYSMQSLNFCFTRLNPWG